MPRATLSFGFTFDVVPKLVIELPIGGGRPHQGSKAERQHVTPAIEPHLGNLPSVSEPEGIPAPFGKQENRPRRVDH